MTVDAYRDDGGGLVPSRRERRELAQDAAFLAAERAAERRDITWRVRAGLAALGHGAASVSPLADPTAGLPVVEDVGLDGPYPVVTVLPPPGFMAQRLRDAAPDLAEVLGVRRVVVEPAEHHRIRLTLLARDPLAESCRLVPQPFGRVMLGVNEDGQVVAVDPRRTPHMIFAGSTGSGKSLLCYTVLAQLATMSDVDVRISDPTGLLVRPWPKSISRVGGLADVTAHLIMLREAVAELDRRLPLIPEDADEITPSVGMPLVFTVLEEYPGLVRAMEHHDTKLAKEMKGYVARLLAESRKVAMRVAMCAQRPEANLIGGFERSNLPFRVSFRVDNIESIRMLHTDPPPQVVAEHIVAESGVALLSGPGIPLNRIRTPFTNYAEYAARVRAANR